MLVVFHISEDGYEIFYWSKLQSEHLGQTI